MGMDEEILARRCREGEDAARRELYERYAGRLLAILIRYTGDRAAAEDLLHDAFLKIFGAFDRFAYRGAGSLRAWIERIAVNVAIEWLRSCRRLAEQPLDEGRVKAETFAEPEAAEVSRIPHEVLLRLVGELPEGYRTVFNLFCIEEYSHREIARMLGIREKSSSSQLARARAMIAGKVLEYLKEHEL